MRYSYSLTWCLWLLSGLSWAQSASAVLTRRVTLHAANAPLQHVLRDISRQTGVGFSYSSTFIPLQKRVTLHTQGAQTMGQVLGQLLQSRGVSYQVIGGQIVLWRTGDKPPGSVPKAAPTTTVPTDLLPGGSNKLPKQPASTVLHPSAQPKIVAGRPVQTIASAKKAVNTGSYKSRPAGRPTVVASTQASLPLAGAGAGRSVFSAPPAQLPTTNDTLRRSSPADTKASDEKPSVLARLGKTVASTTKGATAGLTRTARRTSQVVGRSAQRVAGGTRAVLDSVAAATTNLTQPLQQGVRRLSQVGRRDTLAGRPVAVQSQLPARDTVLAPVPVPPTAAPGAYEHHRGQFAFIAPVGTNGLRSGRSINDYSLNAVAGYAAGVRRAEVGGILNVVRDTVQGFQAAGIVNITGTEVMGVQAAGIVNVVGGSVQGIQAAGVVNVVRDDARGLQVSGFMNVVGGAARARDGRRPTHVRQLLGLPRLLATDPAAQHLAAPSALSLPGMLVQAASVANLTGTDIRGVQTAAVLNTARRVQGLQFGIINVAKHVQGVQLGLINVADSVDGVTLGLVNIVRHGYLHGEVWASETLPLNAALKLGVRRYYTIWSAATQPLGSRVHWATGFGVGTASRQHGRFSWNLDVLGWYLIKQAGTEGTITSYNQLRPSLVWQIEPQGHLGLVFAPTLNVALYENDGDGTKSDFGKNQLLLIDTQSGNTPIRMWVGGQIGLRF